MRNHRRLSGTTTHPAGGRGNWSGSGAFEYHALLANLILVASNTSATRLAMGDIGGGS